MCENDSCIGSRATENRSTKGRSNKSSGHEIYYMKSRNEKMIRGPDLSFFDRDSGTRYLKREGRETPEEIQKSKRSPGAAMVAGKNKVGSVYAWLIYDFAVGETQLKPGHESFLSRISKRIIKYGKHWNKTGTILISGHASPSGVHGKNVRLAEKRAEIVKDMLSKHGVNDDWCFIRNHVSSADIYSVVKGTPTTPRQRSLCRAVYVVLWLKRDLTPEDNFPEKLRKKIRGQIPNRFGKYEEIFYYWVIDNWEYLGRPVAKYASLAQPQEDGLFFMKPKLLLKSDKEVWAYLRRLHKEFKGAAHRLKHKYTGVPGHSPVPAGGKPVRCYQQLARWIALDGFARAGSERVFYFISGKQIQKSMNELIIMVNKGKFGDKKKVWAKIERYMKEKRIPMEVVKKPVF